jgi:hypothetical protein
MFSLTRPLVTVVVTASLLAAAGPAGASSHAPTGLTAPLGSTKGSLADAPPESFMDYTDDALMDAAKWEPSELDAAILSGAGIAVAGGFLPEVHDEVLVARGATGDESRRTS